MAKIRIENGHGLDYECPTCGNDEIELGQNYCQICGEVIEWLQNESIYETEPECDECLCPTCKDDCENAGYEMGTCPNCEGQTMYSCDRYK